MRFAIFDVDLTLTSKDTFIEFYKFLCKQDKRFLIYFNKVVHAGLMYCLKLYDEKKSKEQYLSFLNGLSVDVVNEFSKKFFEEHLLKKMLYKDGLLEIEKCKSKGYKVILISASPEFYLNNFNQLYSIDYVLGTRYEIKDGFYTGKMLGYNNKGEEKVLRLYEFLHKNNIENVDFQNSCMYSDSLNDLPLFNLVGNRFLINSKNKVDNIVNLYWK